MKILIMILLFALIVFAGVMLVKKNKVPKAPPPETLEVVDIDSPEAVGSRVTTIEDSMANAVISNDAWPDSVHKIAPLSPFSEPWIDEATGKEMVALGVSYDKSREAEVLSFLAKFPNITIHKPIENRVNFSLPRDQEAELRKCDAIQHIYPMGAVEAEYDECEPGDVKIINLETE